MIHNVLFETKQLLFDIFSSIVKNKRVIQVTCFTSFPVHVMPVGAIIKENKQTSQTESRDENVTVKNIEPQSLCQIQIKTFCFVL